jgi:NAD(P)-dependent dehydrogenase (short-subunit alcohol dehydrogenase family)
MTTDVVSKTVLITGCSTGIGNATARLLAANGWKVVATARRVADLDDLKTAGCSVLALDVTDEASMRAAVAEVERTDGAVGVLVNNAGYSQGGAIESVSMERVERQFATNVFGTVRMAQLVLPGMRSQRWGKIVNIGSMGGKLTFPGGGFYHATKYALEAITDALRFEVKGFGIDAILIEPGLIRSHFGDTAAGSITDGTPSDDPYAQFNAAAAKATTEAYEAGPLARLGGGPEAVASTIERAISASRPRGRYTVTPSATMMIGLRRFLTDSAWDGFLASQFPRPK